MAEKATIKYIDYRIPRKEYKIAILRLEPPVTKNDIKQILEWLKLMESTIEEAPNE